MSHFGELVAVLTRGWCEGCTSARIWRLILYLFGMLFWVPVLLCLKFTYAMDVTSPGTWAAGALQNYLLICSRALFVSLLFLWGTSIKQYAYCNKNGRQHIHHVGAGFLPTDDEIREGLVGWVRYSFLSWLAPAWGVIIDRKDSPDLTRPTVLDSWRIRHGWVGWAAVSTEWWPWKQHSFHCPTLGDALAIASHQTVADFLLWAVPRSEIETAANRIAREATLAGVVPRMNIDTSSFGVFSGAVLEIVLCYRDLLNQRDQEIITRKELLELKNGDIDHLKKALAYERAVVNNMTLQYDLLGAMVATVAAWSLVRKVNSCRNPAQDTKYLQAVGLFVATALRNNRGLFGEKRFGEVGEEGLFTDFLRHAQQNGWTYGPKALLEAKRQIFEGEVMGRPIALSHAVEKVFGEQSEWKTGSVSDESEDTVAAPAGGSLACKVGD